MLTYFGDVDGAGLQAARRAQNWVVGTEAAHEKARAKIIDRADREIKRQQALLDQALLAKGESGARSPARATSEQLEPLRRSAKRTLAHVHRLAQGRNGAVASEGKPELSPLPAADDPRDVATVVSSWLSTVEAAANALVNQATPTAPPTASPVADDTVGRLLKAVKRFHSAQAAGQALTGNESVAPPPPQATQHSGGGLVPPASVSDPTQITPLSYEEQVELHRDWKQVSAENKDLGTRLRSAKAAVAVGRYREEAG
jgi:hypothetical protein